MVTKRLLLGLKQLKLQPMTGPTMSKDDFAVVQDLVSKGLARDYASFAGQRTELRLRIWGITEAGRAAIEQHELITKTRNRQSTLLLRK